jgi:hypothetical protein
MIILILLPMFAKARLNSIMELVQQILSQFCENVSDSVPTPSRLDPAFDCSTSDNTFPSNAIDYMVSASSPSTAGSASVPDETTPTSAPYRRPINTPDQATTTSTTYHDPSLSSYIKSVEDLVSKTTDFPTVPQVLNLTQPGSPSTNTLFAEYSTPLMSDIAVPDVALVIFTTLIIPSTTISTISIYHAASTANATLSTPASLLGPWSSNDFRYHNILH